MSNETSLRERKKAATRVALSQAAMRLAVEHGVDNITTDAIAEAANVSPRTFHNYFASKEEAILAAFRERVRVIVDALYARPADEPIWDTLQHVATWQVVGTPGAASRAVDQMRLVETSPALLADSMALFDEMERMFAEAIAARTGTGVETDLYPNLLSAAVGAALKTALKLWGTGKSGADLADLLVDAFTQLRAGVPAPAHLTPRSGEDGPTAR